jgi:hypothetical protein
VVVALLFYLRDSVNNSQYHCNNPAHASFQYPYALAVLGVGFRLPSALDNRPLKFSEFEDKIHQCILVSATPSQYELEVSSVIAEQLVRPTGLQFIFYNSYITLRLAVYISQLIHHAV